MSTESIGKAFQATQQENDRLRDSAAKEQPTKPNAAPQMPVSHESGQPLSAHSIEDRIATSAAAAPFASAQTRNLTSDVAAMANQLRMHAGASDTHIPRPMLARAAAMIEQLGQGWISAAWIEHHKGGDNLVWDQPRGEATPLYKLPPPPERP